MARNTLIFSVTFVFSVICNAFDLTTMNRQESNGPKGAETVNITLW